MHCNTVYKAAIINLKYFILLNESTIFYINSDLC